MHINVNMHCCGMREICQLAYDCTPEIAMRAFAEQVLFSKEYNWGAPRVEFGGGMPPQVLRPRRNLGAAHFVFTQATKRAKYGLRFAKLIEDNKLGQVISTYWNLNPNSRRQVKCWVWTPDREALKKWYEANKGEAKT